jgi:predicted P-loop ATPase
MSEKQLATSADASVRQIGVIRQIKENVREFENGGPDTEADDILLAISAGLNVEKVRAIWGPAKGKKADVAPDGALKNPEPQPKVDESEKSRLTGLVSGAELQAILRLDAKAREAKFRKLLVEKCGTPDFDEKKNPVGAQSLAHAIKCVDRFSQMGLRCRYDIFHDKLIIEVRGGAEVAFPGFDKLAGDVDKIVLKMRHEALRAWEFDPSSTHMREAIELACLDNCFNPVLDYLDGLRWDGVPRVDRWLTTYMGAKATELNSEIGRKVLVAAVRRIRRPGCKFDFVLVLENERQGLGRGTALRILAGDENFSDAEIIRNDKREQQELIKGVWIYELGELEGLSAVAAAKLKAFLSRQFDSARPAYGHVRVDWPRQCIFVGTTNEVDYLNDTTGNRRIWPVWIDGVVWSEEAQRMLIDLAGLRRDRDQLWAEAAQIEEGGEPLHIPERLWGVAEIEQGKRLAHDGWEDQVAARLSELNWKGKGRKNEWGVATDATTGSPQMRVSSSWLLDTVCEVPKGLQDKARFSRLARVMRVLGWTASNQRVGKGDAATATSNRTSLNLRRLWKSFPTPKSRLFHQALREGSKGKEVGGCQACHGCYP